MYASTAGSVCVGTICICPSPSHLPTTRLSAAVLLMISKPLKADDLRCSPKDLCSKNSLLEWDMPMSIHQILIYHRLPPCPWSGFCWDLFLALVLLLFYTASWHCTTFLTQLCSPVSLSLSLSISPLPAWPVCSCLLQRALCSTAGMHPTAAAVLSYSILAVGVCVWI